MKNSTEVIAYVSLATTLISVLWNVFFGYGQLVSKIDALQEDLKEFKVSVNTRFDKLENKFDRMEGKYHDMDIRG